MGRKRKLSFHRRASASFPLGDGTEIAFSDPPAKLTRVAPSKPPLGPPPSPHSSYLHSDSNSTALSHHRLPLSHFPAQRASGPRERPGAENISKQAGWGLWAPPPPWGMWAFRGCGVQVQGDLKMTQLKGYYLKVWKVMSLLGQHCFSGWEGDNELLPREMKLLINSKAKLREVKLHF